MCTFPTSAGGLYRCIESKYLSTHGNMIIPEKVLKVPLRMKGIHVEPLVTERRGDDSVYVMYSCCSCDVLFVSKQVTTKINLRKHKPCERLM